MLKILLNLAKYFFGLGLALYLTACGQTGALYLPETTNQPASQTENQP